MNFFLKNIVNFTNLDGKLHLESEFGITLSKSRHCVIIPGDREVRDCAHNAESSAARTVAAKAV